PPGPANGGRGKRHRRRWPQSRGPPCRGLATRGARNVAKRAWVLTVRNLKSMQNRAQHPASSSNAPGESHLTHETDKFAGKGKRQAQLWLALACCAYILMEGTCYLLVTILRARNIEFSPLPTHLSQEQKNFLKARLRNDGPLSGHHPVLGWSPRPLT